MLPIPKPTPTPYAERPEWKDVVAIPQQDAAEPLVPIFYSPEYKDAADYFRGIVKINEKSERVLELTEHLIRLNPAHYSVWQYRYDTLLAISADLHKELKLMDEFATLYLKHYQVWHHRRLLLTILQEPLPELTFIGKALAKDAKNYHTWAYRQWILSHFDQEDLWKGELQFAEMMLDQDLRNNSAWHHRFFVVWDSGVRPDEAEREDVLRRELAYTKEKISLAPNNPSAWNYLRGVLNRTKTPFSELRGFVLPFTEPQPLPNPHSPVEPAPDSEEVDLENPLPSSSAQLPCALAVEFLADIEELEHQSQRAAELFRWLGNELDTIRKKYWEYRAKEATTSTQTVSTVPADVTG